MSTTVVENCAVATVDEHDTVHAAGHIVITDGRVTAVGAGAAPEIDADIRIDGTGCLATPGLVNTHHHFYQWLTRGLAQQSTLFEWLVELYPVWARLDADLEHAAASAALSALALSGCTSAMDHHYVVPREGGDLFVAEIEAAQRIGLRFHPTRGSMDLGRSRGGLPPDSVVEDLDTILASSENLVAQHHDPAPDSMLRIGLAPCSPFSVTDDLMRQSAELARRLGLRLHTHLAETEDEEQFCLEQFGKRPVDYVDSLGYLGPDVWLAHCVHLSDDDIARFGASGTGVAHCPSSNARLGAGIARVPELLAAGVPVGLGVDGVASNEAGELGPELRQALLVARARSGPRALTAAQSLRLGTMGGARCLGRDAELGSLEVGKLGDVALWRLDDGIGHADIDDPVCALVFGSLPPVDTLLVGGVPVVSGGELRTADVTTVARELRAAAAALRTGTRG